MRNLRVGEIGGCGMNCKECYWCALNHSLSDKFICCNEKSRNYNEIFPKEEREIKGCEDGEIKQAVDYRNMTAWGFASRYYM